jgi:tRNA-specific 2-thiouridylase
VADKRESQDLCFLAGVGGRGFLRRHGGRRLARGEGKILTRDGRMIGSHAGQHDFTVGQRRGLGVPAKEPMYVLARDAARNEVVVGTREELATQVVPVEGLELHRPEHRVHGVELRLSSPVHAAAPGQLACLLDGDLVVGHATVKQTIGAQP